jgi:signal transduction histidine kinase
VLAQVRGCGVPVSLTVSGSPVELSPGIDLTAFRIVQEALTNTIRHSPGADASVDISYEEGSVTVRVSNTGPAPPSDPASNGAASASASNGHASPGAVRLPDPASSRLGPGFGLAGIAERVSSCGGTLTVGPSESGGFAVTARLPVS